LCSAGGCTKCKGVILNIKQKLYIISQSKEGVSIKYHPVIYGAGETTVCDIRDNKHKIINSASSSDSTSGLSK
jgi:hypothetical protein